MTYEAVPAVVIDVLVETTAVAVTVLPQVTALELALPQAYVPVYTGGSAPSFTHEQRIPATEWSVSHPLGVRPTSVTLLDVLGNWMVPNTAEVSASRVVFLFGRPTAGTAILGA